jgi:hypothetical protein
MQCNLLVVVTLDDGETESALPEETVHKGAQAVPNHNVVYPQEGVLFHLVISDTRRTRVTTSGKNGNSTIATTAVMPAQ